MRVKRGSSRRSWAIGALVVAGLLGGLPAPAAHAAGETVPMDFNGDGYRDAVLRVPAAKVAGRADAGAVIVLYGSPSGLSAKRRAFLTQNSPGVPDTAETGDYFGASTASADLDRDGYADLVIGAPYENLSFGADKGAVTILWGSRSGLVSGRLLPTPRDFDMFGRDVTAAGKGTSSTSLVTVGGWNFTQTFNGPFTRARGATSSARGMDMWFGSVTAGDLNRDGRADTVAVSGRVSSGGHVFVNAEQTTEWGDYLKTGDALVATVGDVNGDGYGDIVAGDPDEPERRGVDGERGGRVLIWYGGPSGVPVDAVPVVISQDSSGVPDTGETYDRFGASVAVADFDRDGVGDIAVGAPGEKAGTVRRAGTVTLIPGRRTGVPGVGAYLYSQETVGVPSAGEADDQFGTNISAGDVNRDGRPEMLVSAVGENGYAGAVWVLPGGAVRPAGSGSQVFTTSLFGLPAQGYQLLGGDSLPQ
ncbi:VCBS repeat-containing protein [Streptomyces sp. NPDC058739]|uniref:VCBS repeat-containing protein n=1 Tax=Streptomyces sp. NPDC058739 TaxID=3346618 RepID=UPI0036B621C3